VSEAARREDLVRADARARRAAREVFDRPLVLEAGAGTGKTTALVTRVLAWCCGPGWERAEAWLRESDPEAAVPQRIARRVLRRVVAITFTEAAAAEMDQRVSDALRRVEADELPAWLPEDALPASRERRRERAAALRGAVDLLVVQTIHAYCRRLLLTYPLEAGLHPRLEIDADGRHQAEIVREVLEERLPRAYAEGGDPDYLALAERGIDPPQLEEQLLGLLEAGVAAAALEDDPLAAARLAALDQRARRAVADFRAATGDCFHHLARGNKIAIAVAGLVEEMSERLEQEPWTDSEALAAGAAWIAERWEGSALKRLEDWAKEKFNKTEQEVVEGREEAIAEHAERLAGIVGHLISLDLELLGLARGVLRELLAEVEKRLRARGVATFSALLTETRDLLLRRQDVAARVRARIDQLLVDEFQDTDRRQCDILRALALSGPGDGRPGLFLVGDPKQSIYGWRSADLAAYDAFVDDVAASGGSLERLSVNYRSAPAILDEVERAVEPVMLRSEGVQPAFQPLVPGPATAGDPGFAHDRFAPTEYWVSARWDAEAGALRATPAGAATELEAQALAREIRSLHEAHGVAWKEVGVLLRGRSDLEVYLGALRAADVPYAVEGDRSYYQRREVIEATALVRSVLDPNDHLALLALLRSAAVGVPDVALIPLWTRGLASRIGALSEPSPEVLEALRAELVEVVASLPEVPGLDRVRGWEESLLAMLDALLQLRRSFGREPPDLFVERMRRLSLFETTEAARFLGAWRSANLDRFFRELAGQLDEGAGPQAILRRLRRGVGQEEQQEEGRPKDAIEDAVQVTTIHGAKGLDFEHVYLVQLHKGSGRDGRGGVEPGEVDGALEYRLLGAPTPGWDRVARDRDSVAKAEQVRTLYVAMTRAKRRLVLAGLWPEHQRSVRPGQTMQLLQERREGRPELDATAAELVARGVDFQDAARTRWVFPGLPAAQAAGALRRRRRAAALPPPLEVAREAQALHAARERARLHQARAFGGAASAAAQKETLAERGERGSGQPVPAGAASGRGGEVARAVGTAIHRVLEEFDFAADPRAELARQRAALETLLAGRADAALAEARELLEQIAQGKLFARLRALAGGILHRELPVLVPPEPGAGPAGYVSGVVDLVYRDPASGELVIADYKTDRLEEAGAQERSAAYRGQGAVYQTALRDGLGLVYTPRFELWYLRADVCV
jgi:ATP-dependent helicase/nuclease subunit A